MHVGPPIHDIDSDEIVGYQAAYVATAIVKVAGRSDERPFSPKVPAKRSKVIASSPSKARGHSISAACADHGINGQIISIADDAERSANTRWWC